MSGFIAAVVTTVTEIAASVAATAAFAEGAIGGLVCSGLGTLGVGAETAGAIGSAVGTGAVGAVEGSALGAASSAAMGGDPGQGALFGAISGGIASGIGPAVGDLAKGVGLTGDVAKGATTGVSNALGGMAAQGITNPKGNLLLPALGGLASGVVDYAVGDLPKNASWFDKALATGEKGVLNTATSFELSNLFAPQQSAQTAGGSSSALSGSGQTISAPATGQGISPNSSALGQALRVDAGSPVFGTDSQAQSGKSGWNQESLRYMGGNG